MGRKQPTERARRAPVVVAEARCPSGKIALRGGPKELEGWAGHFARQLNETGRVAQDIYAYRCPDCRWWHFTRRRGGDLDRILVHRAAPLELQQWAMTRAPGGS